MLTSERFTIVVGIDLSDYADAVLEHAFDEAVRHDRPTLHVLTVVAEPHHWWHKPTPEELSRAESDAKERLAGTVRRALEEAVPVERRTDWNVRLHVRRGRPEEQIVALSDETVADLVVVGRFGHAAQGRRGIGSIADRVVAACECPVLVVHGGRDRTAAVQQCPDCVRVRASSDGERWFCDRHHGDHLHHSTLLDVMTGTRPIGGGPLW
jgi:nucleotide-binding universal stress UspA family protein